jgi:hypothetical protein
LSFHGWVSGVFGLSFLPLFHFFSRLLGCAILGVLSCMFRCERFCGAGIFCVLFFGSCVALPLGCGCADFAPAFFDVLYPLRGRCVWALCPCPSSLLQHALHTVILRVELTDGGDLDGIPQEWHFGCLVFSQDMHSRFREVSFLPSSVFWIPRAFPVRSLNGRGTNVRIISTQARYLHAPPPA